MQEPSDAATVEAGSVPEVGTVLPVTIVPTDAAAELPRVGEPVTMLNHETVSPITNPPNVPLQQPA